MSTPELTNALSLLRYLWQEADLETHALNGLKVRDLFADADPLADDIEAVLAALQEQKR